MGKEYLRFHQEVPVVLAYHQYCCCGLGVPVFDLLELVDPDSGIDALGESDHGHFRCVSLSN